MSSSRKHKYAVLVPLPAESMHHVLTARGKKAATRSKKENESKDEKAFAPSTALGDRLLNDQAETKLSAKTFRQHLIDQSNDVQKIAKTLLKRLTKKPAKRDVYPKLLYLEPLRENENIATLNLKAGDVLYVVAHGNPATLGSGSERSDEIISLSPIELAHEIEAAGVPKQLTKLKVMACNSGLLETNVDDPEDSRLFVRDLCIELYKLGYTKIHVSGYIGYTQEDPKSTHSLAAPSLTGKARFRASDSRITVSGPKGEPVASPKKIIVVDDFKEPTRLYRYVQTLFEKKIVESPAEIETEKKRASKKTIP